MKYALVAASAVVLLSPVQVAAQGRTPIEIEANRPTLAAWVADVSGAIDTNLRYPSYFGRNGPESGYASISFRVGADGAPVDVVLRRTSGSSRLDRAALNAVAGLSGIEPMPRSSSSMQSVRANIVFAADEVTLARLHRQAHHVTVIAGRNRSRAYHG